MFQTTNQHNCTAFFGETTRRTEFQTWWTAVWSCLGCRQGDHPLSYIPEVTMPKIHRYQKQPETTRNKKNVQYPTAMDWNLSQIWVGFGKHLGVSSKKMEILPRVSPKKKGDATPMVRNPQIVSDFAHVNSTGVSPSCTDKPRTCLRLFGCRLKILQSAGRVWRWFLEYHPKWF